MNEESSSRPAAPQEAPLGAPSNLSSDLIAKRRAQLFDDKAEVAMTGELPRDSSDVWGLALSGGGIRSATFSLGLLRGLASQGLLSRFDLLSTVSGGSYVGSMLGRLYDRIRPGGESPSVTGASNGTPPPAAADQVQAAMADAQGRWFGWWLRANGRYLAPAGFADRLFAITLYLRNLLALHFEFGLLAVLAGSLLAALDLGVWQGLAAAGYQWDTPSLFNGLMVLKPWLPTAWLLLVLVVPIALHLVLTYWDSQWVAKHFARYCFAKLVMSFVLIAAAVLVREMAQFSAADQESAGLARLLPGIALLVVLLLATSAAHARASWLRLRPAQGQQMARDSAEKDALSEMRNRLTLQLRACLGIALLILALGIAERLAWLVAFQTREFETLDLGIALAVISGVAQALMLSLRASKGRQQRQAAPPSRLVPLLLQLAGYLLAAALFVWWVSLVLKVGFTPVFPEFAKSDGAPVEVIPPQFDAGWLTLLCIVVPTALYVAATGSNLGFLNLSSLHTFYKARLVRSYLGATNPTRFSGSGAASALARIAPNELTTNEVSNVGKVAPGDDVSLAAYQPHLAGGPVHIISTCVNQTADPKGRLFNRDRKGLILSVRGGGASRFNQEGWRSEFPGIGKLSLGGWMAISGAAAAPGLGARTQRGLAALLTLAGVRLGYWLSRDDRGGPTGTGRASIRRRLAGMAAKSAALGHELSASFSAGPEDDWFVTDGGHFENTGVYPLLLERASVIVLADCGADPGYSFEDIENLVRKARIDMNITITFRQPRDPGLFSPATDDDPECDWCETIGYFGTLQDLAKDDNESCLALATIHYPDAPPAILIVVKPNICRSVSMDVANYKRQCPLFPQEPTSDQFFSESQWESYFALGNELGSYLNRPLINQIRAHLEVLFDHDAENTPSLPASANAAVYTKPLSDRTSRSVWGRQVGPVGATVGAGVVLSLAVAAWQSIDAYRTAQKTRMADERAALVDISKLWEQLPPATSSSDLAGAANRLAVALLRAGDTYCMKGDAGWLMKSEFGRRVIADGVLACASLKGSMGPACQAMVEARSGLKSLDAGSCLVRTAPPSPTVYWGYDYSEGGNWKTLHPCSTQRSALVEQYSEFKATYQIAVNDTRSPEELAGVRVGCHALAATAAHPTDGTEMAMPAPPPVAVAPPEASAEPDATTRPERSSAAQIAASPLCKGNTIYMQIYGPDMRNQVRVFRSWWHDKWQASVPPIEDVVATAFRAARPAPKEVSRTTVRYHDATGYECASNIVSTVQATVPGADWALEPLSPALNGARGVIEVWFSRTDNVPGQWQP